MVENLITLALLTLLQGVLGFDNLLYVSLESKRAPAARQAMVRRVGIGVAMVLRIALLFILMRVIDRFQTPLLTLHHSFLSGSFNLHAVIVLLGGGFILYTATREILHMMILEEEGHEERSTRSVRRVITSIVLMNLVFSFDSILSAMALSDVFWVMGTAIVIGAALMLVMADTVSEFLRKNRMYEVLGLFVLFIVGIMLLSEGGHLAHLHFFGHAVTAMSKATFYFVIGVLVLTDVVQGRYQKRLMRMKAAE
ncbi:MAG: hypothetical protein DHS20C21_18750 [Gemmatimonadota bacterium]|nr:MAG: hypothetical protein DHS20C21_18750 [Gemmatimonadota bacterium]